MTFKYDYAISEYGYEELAEQALRFDATQEDLDHLAQWFETFGMRFWNGECYEIDNSHYLYYIYEEDENGDFKTVGYEIRFH